MKQEIEIWKDIPGYEGIYQCSTFGRVKSFKCNKEKQISLTKKLRGYIGIYLSKNKIKKYFYIHRLVAITFIPNPENKPCVDHINTVRDDNRVENLCW